MTMNRLNPITSEILQHQKVTVSTTARLHMGFVDLNGSQGRLFGSLGVALSGPKTQLTIEKSKKPLIEAKNHDCVAKIVENIKNHLKIEANFSIKVHENIPEHAGLGSGTQMALAIGAGINALFGLNFSAAQIANMTSRGRRSGIGIGTFEQGGFVVDGGRSTSHANKIPPIIARHDFPQNWPILLMMDNDDQGVFGDAELQAFESLPAVDLSIAQRLSHRVLMQALPAIAEQDYAQFSQAIYALQLATGEYFSVAQGGHYKSIKVAQVLNYLNQQGIICAGQSSWGPTGFAVFEDEISANTMLTQLQQQFEQSRLHFQLMRANNSGAIINLS
ncbi:MAG: beta-ribofuranosylaminobenzene 5'-phosphate synthase family protein [Pseudomonadota bacterium]